MTRSRHIVVICLVLGAHVLLDLLLLGGGWEVRGGWDLFLLAWPLSQGSLVAVWAALSPMRSYVRFPAALLALAWTWFLTVEVLTAYEATGEESAGWAAMFATQALAILILATVGRLVCQRIERRRSGGSEGDFRPVQFSLAFLLLWTTILAVVLGLGRTVLAALGWTAEVVKWQYFFFCPVLGACNAAFALIVLASLVGRNWLVARVLLATILVAVLGYAEWHLFMLLFGDTGGVKEEEFLMLAAFEAAYLYATLLPLRLCGCFGPAARGKRPQQPDSPFAPPDVPCL